MIFLYKFNLLKLKILKLFTKFCSFLFFSNLFGQMPNEGYQIIILNSYELNKLKFFLKKNPNKKFHIHLMDPRNENFSLCVYFKLLNKNLTYSFSINYFNNDTLNKKILLNTCFLYFKEFKFHDNRKSINLKKLTKLIKTPKKILFCPTHDIPHKKPKGLVTTDLSRKKNKIYWIKFENKIIRNYKNIQQISVPLWMINKTIIKYFKDTKLFLIPHNDKQRLPINNAQCLYYMQSAIPFLFTLDPEGYCGGASFVDKFDSQKIKTESGLKFLKTHRYLKKYGFKFNHLQKNEKIKLKDYIFVPLQLPYDEQIRHFSRISCESFVEKLCSWSQKKNIRLLFKGHPVNLVAMEKMRKIISNYNNCYYTSDCNINEAITNSSGVFLINSGTAFESMLLKKKIVSFGTSEYQNATIRGNIKKLDQTYKNFLDDNLKKRVIIYKNFFSWYYSKSISVL